MGVALLSKPSISRKKWELLKAAHLKNISDKRQAQPSTKKRTTKGKLDN